MIKLRDLICETIAERMNFDDLMKSSDTGRKERASNVSVKPLAVSSLSDREAWKFSYKTSKNESTTGLRHQGFIYFFKENINVGDNAMKLDCSVDCSCKDYRYRWAYNNKSNDAGEVGGNSLNKNNGRPPEPYNNLGPGLCKHLISLKEYLRTTIEAEPVVQPTTNQVVQKPVVTPKSTATNFPIDEPEEEKDKVVDPTQTPEGPDDEKELSTTEPETPENDSNVDKTQTPQKPDPEQDTEVSDEEELNKNKKLKESSSNKNNVVKILDNLCKTKKLFIINYYD